MLTGVELEILGDLQDAVETAVRRLSALSDPSEDGYPLARVDADPRFDPVRDAWAATSRG
jgi:hypothetical protein